MKHFRGFFQILSHAILIHAYVTLFPGIETNIASKIKTFPRTTFRKLKVYLKKKTNVNLKLQNGL